MNKINIINGLIDEQKKIILTIEDSILRYKNASDLDENDSSDPEDFSHQDEAKDMQLRYEQMLIQTKNNLEFLELCKSKNCVSIENGSLIETENLYLFIGISLPQFELNNKKVISITEQAPVFNSIKEKSLGEKITIGSTENTILAIS
ncbi:MAG: hypothetical protein JNJ52_00530 [Flavobacterium sp.]|nr:hypothetical protein [Flavobacterium sp.]